MAIEVIIDAGCEGGGVTLYGMRQGTGWRYCRHLVDHIAWMFDDGPWIEHDSEVVGTWAAATKLLDKYTFHELYPLRVHPEFRQIVLKAVKARYKANKDKDLRTLPVWEKLCSVVGGDITYCSVDKNCGQEMDDRRIIATRANSKVNSSETLVNQLPTITAHDEIEKSALQGSQRDAMALAIRHLEGTGVTKSKAEAFAWTIWAKLHCDADPAVANALTQLHNFVKETISAAARRKSEKSLAEIIVRGNYRRPVVTHPLAKAIAIAAKAHLTHPPDRGGAPYILHPLRLMSMMATDEEKMTAVLHDVVEDHSQEGFTFEYLAEQGIPMAVIIALRCVTKTEDEERRGDAAYASFIARAAANPIARAVKLADLEDNLNTLRLGELTDKDVTRLRKYHSNWLWLKSQ